MLASLASGKVLHGQRTVHPRNVHVEKNSKVNQEGNGFKDRGKDNGDAEED